MTKEFNLSEKITNGGEIGSIYNWITTEDVKEFIKRLKEEHRMWKEDIEVGVTESFASRVNRLAGDDLK